MPKTISNLSQEVGIPTDTLKQFIIDFDLNIADCITPKQEVTDTLQKFALDNKSFLQDYSNDLKVDKNAGIIADKINQPKDKVEDLLKNTQPNIFENGFYKTSISSYQVDEKLGGNYQFIYNYFGKKTALFQKEFIGYNDLYFYIIDMLEPFIDPDQVKNWGIQCAAGIVLYGPPGSGKIFWAKKIADIIKYQFEEIRQTYLTTSFINGKKSDFNDFLVQIMKTEKVILFLDNFDEIMQEQSEIINIENETTKDLVLHSIDKFAKSQILMIGSANKINNIDPELMTPGRFDLLIPIFPPNAIERAKMIMHFMTKDLEENAILLNILKNNNADHLPFWNEIASQMKAFSNTMVIDFTQSLKKRLRSQYQKQQSESVTIDKPLLLAALKESQGKLTNEYLDNVASFLQELNTNSGDIFANRVSQTREELSYYMKKETPSRSIGFNSSENTSPENNN